MAFHNTNYEVVELTGTMGPGELGNGVTASTVHEIYCLSAGVIEITPLKGSSFSWNATTNDSIKVLAKEVTVSSGEFIGFKTYFQARQSQFQNQG